MTAPPHRPATSLLQFFLLATGGGLRTVVFERMGLSDSRCPCSRRIATPHHQSPPLPVPALPYLVPIPARCAVGSFPFNFCLNFEETDLGLGGRRLFPIFIFMIHLCILRMISLPILPLPPCLLPGSSEQMSAAIHCSSLLPMPRIIPQWPAVILLPCSLCSIPSLPCLVLFLSC